jgi:hypothetical protein
LVVKENLLGSSISTKQNISQQDYSSSRTSSFHENAQGIRQSKITQVQNEFKLPPSAMTNISVFLLPLKSPNAATNPLADGPKLLDVTSSKELHCACLNRTKEITCVIIKL